MSSASSATTGYELVPQAVMDPKSRLDTYVKAVRDEVKNRQITACKVVGFITVILVILVACKVIPMVGFVAGEGMVIGGGIGYCQALDSVAKRDIAQARKQINKEIEDTGYRFNHRFVLVKRT